MRYVNYFFTTLSITICCTICASAQTNDHQRTLSKEKFANPDNKYPYWGGYCKTPISEIRAATWRDIDGVEPGWDWSLPPAVKAAPVSSLCIARNWGLNPEKIKSLPKVNFPCNPVVALWVNWSLLEPKEGEINFKPLKDNIKFAAQRGYQSIVRIHFSATDFAPEWIKKYNIPIREERKPNPKKINYDVSHQEFHKRYLRFIKALGESGIPQMEEVKGLFFGYASPSNGDEGIGPYPENELAANDTVRHVVERIDAWAEACVGVEHKVCMGGLSNYGLSKGFGVRRGFIEMYLYHIPDKHIGQCLDKDGYLYVDETNPIIANNTFHGEENEEYDEVWATPQRDFRFGPTTVSYPYRYFTSNLRLLQMRCNDVLYNDFSIAPQMLAWVGLELGKTIDDAADVWCALRESYLKADKGTTVKNFERWLYQRDQPGYETTPAMKIVQPIHMWMVQPERYYDFIAREGKKIGFDINDRWLALHDRLAIKITYFDNEHGTLNLVLNDGRVKSIPLTGDRELKTATLFVGKINESSTPYSFDFVLEAGGNAESITISFVRIITV